MGVFRVFGKGVILILLCANVLLLLLIALSGSIEKEPIDRFYWLEANTSGIQNAKDISRWTYWGLCSRDDKRIHNRECTNLSPAYPISPKDNFNGNTRNIPEQFVNDRDTYYYLSRFAFCFFLAALVFFVMALLMIAFSWCSYSFTKVLFFMTSIGCLFDVAAVSCQTAVIVLARKAFNKAGRHAQLGPILMGLAWASVGLSFLLFFSTGISFIRRAWSAHQEFVEMQNYKQQALKYQDTKDQSPFYEPHGTSAAAVYDTPTELEQQHALQQQQVPLGPPPESRQSGVKFFKVRRNKQPTDDDSI